jgi:hypothetical protein
MLVCACESLLNRSVLYVEYTYEVREHQFIKESLEEQQEI